MDAIPTDPVLEISPSGAYDPPLDAPVGASVTGSLGISATDRTDLRRVVLRAARVALAHRGIMQYSEGPARWSGITMRKRSVLNQYPPYADCSSFFAWCHWDASRWLKLPDYVNGQNWQAGYTGTMTQHGQAVASVNDLMPGDAVFYFNNASIPGHIALYIGGGRVISHGRPGDPTLLPYNAVAPIVGYRRYIY